MTEETAILKARLRREIRVRIGTLTVEQRASAATRACAVLAAQPVWKAAGSVLFYAALGDEIDLSKMLTQALEERKIVALPGFVHESGTYGVFQITDPSQDCAPGKFGIAEPLSHCPIFPLNHLDLALAPGVGFDLSGHRLGRGGGYYDRLLTRVTGVKCGIAFDEQLVHQIPAEPHDIQMNYILTPTRWMETTGELPMSK